MRKNIWLHCGLSALVLAMHPVTQAAYDCTTTSPSLNVRYNQGTVQAATGQLTVSCTRATNDPANTTYSIGLNQGEPPAGRQYSRIGGGSTLNYQIYREATYTSTWNDSSRRVTGTINFGAGTVATVIVPLYLRIPSQTGKQAGTYDDTAVRVRVRIPQTGAVIGEDFVSFYAVIDPVCNITSAPGNINLNYTSFSAAPVISTTNFSVNCTNQTPYTMSLSANSGVIAGIAYSLSLSSTSVNATGLAQNHTVSATAPAGQAGTCAGATCTGTQARILTITY